MVFERIEKAEKLFERSQNLQKSRKGLSKLKRKIFAQVKFLNSVRIIINQPTSLARAQIPPSPSPFNAGHAGYNCYYSCAFPVGILNNSVLIPGKVLHIGKVKLFSYKEYLSVVRFSQVGRELIICLTTLNIIIFTLILCLFYRLV